MRPRGRNASSRSVRREPLVPRADLLADVASVHQLADRVTTLDGNLAFELDRQIRDAARSHRARAALDDRAGRTRVDAPAARSAMIAANGASGSSSRSRSSSPRKKNDPTLRIDEHRVLSEPAEPGAPREVALEHRTGVDVRLAGDRAPDDLVDSGVQLREGARAVRRDSRRRAHSARPDRTARVRRSPGRRRSRSCAVAKGQARVATLFRGARHVVHLARVAVLEPFVERARRLGRSEPGDADEIEAEPVRLRLDQRLDHGFRTAHVAYRSTSSAVGTAIRRRTRCTFASAHTRGRAAARMGNRRYQSRARNRQPTRTSATPVRGWRIRATPGAPRPRPRPLAHAVGVHRANTVRAFTNDVRPAPPASAPRAPRARSASRPPCAAASRAAAGS